MTTRVLVVRHGQSTWNSDGRWQGQADPPLSALGEQQALDAARTIERTAKVDAIWSSDLLRASRTADIIGAHLGHLAHLDARLRERDAGEWQGLTRHEIDVHWPGYLESGRRPPAFERDDALLARVLSGVDAITASHTDGSVLVVAHGGIVRTLERHLGDDDRELLPNLGGRWVLVEGGSARLALGERVLLLDEAEVTRPRQL
ncbi:MAG TPA: histidine phosphatase family protein [Acidimicrobiia bacterium]|jgi:broad specificity phosphatase PhoE